MADLELSGGLQAVIEGSIARQASGAEAAADSDLIQLYREVTINGVTHNVPDRKIRKDVFMQCVVAAVGPLLNQGAADLGTSLAKIPALNSGGTLGSATVANLASVLGGLNPQQNNCNNCVEGWNYIVVGASNRPDDPRVNGRTLWVYSHLTNAQYQNRVQFAVCSSDGQYIFHRSQQDGTWSNWHEVSLDIPLFYKNYANLSALRNGIGMFEFVDMGLPSGTLWASKNLGADTITDYGAYFSWGNVQGQKPNGGTFPQTWGSSNDTEPYVSSEGAALTGDIPLNLDAANYYLGGKAKMPTKDQFVELFNSSYTTNEWTTLHGVAGRLVTSKANGNTIFFPAAGRGNGTSLNGAGSYGFYWSRSLQSSTDGYRLFFSSSSVSPQDNYGRYSGFSVRAVL